MNKRSGPGRPLPQRLGDLGARKPRRDVYGRQWRREVNRLTEDDLIAVVRGMVSVDRAVNTFRKGTDRAVFLPPTETPAGWDK